MSQAPVPAKNLTPADWAQPGIGPRWRHAFFYWVIRVGGRARGYHMGNLAAFWYVLFYPSIRRRCRFYLDRRFPQRRSPVKKFFDTFHLVRSYAATLVDMKIIEILGPRAIAASNPDHDRLYELTQREHGFVLIHAHVGCWQIGMSTLGQFPKPVSILMIPEPQTRSLVTGKVTSVIDPRTGLQSAMQMADALLRGEIVAMMGDRTFGSDQTVVPARFLGGQVLLPVTPFRLASATGAPVLVMTAPKTARRTYELRLAKIIDVPTGLGRNPANYGPYAQQFADCLEQFVQQYPWQFYNFYNFWNQPEKS